MMPTAPLPNNCTANSLTLAFSPAQDERITPSLVALAFNLYRKTMTERDFAYWLNGFVEMNGGAMPSATQWKAIQEHLALVFKKVTPPVVEETKKTESVLEKTLREYSEKQARYPTDPIPYPTQPYPYPTQPYWLQPSFYPPGTVVCSTGLSSSPTTGLVSC